MPGLTTEAVRSVLSLFDGRRAEHPDALAVVDENSTRTYAQLDAEAAGYAQALAAHGIGPETVVPVVAVRSGQYVAMVLGVLRAGAAFLPVDPSTPPRRARQMCTAVNARVLLVQPGLESYAAELVDEPGRVLSAVPTFERRERAVEPPSREPAGLAYVIFTSGSTGIPKGAMVTNAGLANHVAAKTLDLELGPADVVGFTASLSFDISVWQALTALTVGGCVAVASPADMSEPIEMLAWVGRRGVTIVELVPSFMAVLVDELELDEQLVSSFSTLRFIIATGEALPVRLAQRWYASCPEIVLVNAYGPTECSDDVTHHLVTQAECAAGRPPSIGVEIVNTRVYIVDSDGREVPSVVEGELLVGGGGVGRGYIGDPARTAIAFVPDYLSGEAGTRLYRTGDRGRRAADGTIDYLGRRDRQVKIRGHRVELGDVESELFRVEGVASAAAVLSQGRLHAFVTLQLGGDGSAEGGRVLDVLRRSAPASLVPHEVTVLERMPTNPSGKIDYDALVRRPGAAGAAATTRDEHSMLAAVCDTVAEVLELPRVAPDDDFFEAGGDSLCAMTLLSLARKRFDAPDAALSGFLAEPTPRGLLGVLEAAKAAEAAPRTAETEAAPGALSSGQERLWFLEQLHPTRGAQLIRFALSLRGPLDPRALEHALSAVIIRHEPLRTVFSQERGIPVARVWPHAEVPLDIVALNGHEPVFELDDTRGLSARTEKPPLMVAQLAKLSPDHHIVSLLLHHLIADGFSLGVLGREIGAYYGRYLEGDVNVPRPESTFSRYVSEERRWLDSAEAAACERYWVGELADAPRVIELPLDRPHPARPDFAARSVVYQLTTDETTLVAQVARAKRATPFMAATTAFYAVLRDLTRSDDLVVGIDSANRSWPGSEQLIGTFVNQPPVRLTSSPAERTFSGMLDLVRRQCLAAYAHDRLPFHKIVAAVNPPRRAGRFPLFQVKVTHQGAWRDGLTLSGVEVVPSVLAEPVTDLDLMLDVSGESSRLRLELVYRPEVLDEETAASWVDAIGDVLSTGTIDPDAMLASSFADHGGRAVAPTVGSRGARRRV